MPSAATLVVDNGSYTIKAGFTTSDTCITIPNCIARTRDKRVLIGQQLESCRDFGCAVFRRPVEKGYLVNWEAEKEIWDRTFLDSESKLKCDPRNTTLLLTEAPNAPSALQTNCDQMVFEEYEFSAYYRCVGPTLIPWNDTNTLYSPGNSPFFSPPAEAIMVVDSGFSHTHITPIINGQLWNTAVRRIDVGGKFLTNYLKEMVSTRTWNMMEETHLINQVKESVCYISTNFNEDLEKCHSMKKAANDIVVDFVLPDYNSGKAGYRRPHAPKKQPAFGSNDEQVMELSDERFSVPELLFAPQDIGLAQAGIAETIMQSLEGVPERYRSLLLANIVVVGGNANIAGFLERLEMELRPLAPAESVVRIAKPDNPVTYTWQGGVALAGDQTEMKKRQVTRAEYMEYGSVWCAKKMTGEVSSVPGTGPAGAVEKENRSHKKKRVED
ncbi:actin family [Tuber brumale]|nr:actin family [Tuber brumale]